MTDERFEVVMGALLHDIGKFIQRGEGMYEKKHEDYGREFVLNNLPTLTEEQREVISALVGEHHQNLSKNPDIASLLAVVRKADRLSAEHDRKEEIEEKNVYKTPLRSIFSELFRDQFKEGEIPIQNLPPVAVSDKIWDTREFTITAQDYRRLYDGFKEDLKKIQNTKSEDALLNSLNYLLMKWTRYVPSAVYLSVPDIPLYDHLKTTAAMALSILEGDKDKPFLLIGGDVSGIQDFIFYNRSSENVDDKATKRMRGRSFLINLIVDATTKYIVEEMNLYEPNVLWATGGVFLILAPNNEENRKRLQAIRRDVNLYLHRTFKRLTLVITGMEVGEDGMKQFHRTLDELFTRLDEEKDRKYTPIWEDLEFVGDRKGINEICPSCGMPLKKKEKERCETCLNEEKLGGKVAAMSSGSRLVRICCTSQTDADWVFDFDQLKVAYTLYKSGDVPPNVQGDIFTLNDTRFLTSDTNMNGFKFFGTHLPRRENKILSINEMLMMSDAPSDRDFAPLALFKADVDNLGILFSEGFKNKDKSISRLTFLSFLLDLYFSLRIKQIAKEKEVYVIFSGGDDLVVAGRYDNIFEFAEEVNRSFKSWTSHPYIHLSGGIVLAHQKFPLRKLVEYGEEALERSKEYSPEGKHFLARKNAITAFGTTVTWPVFERQMEFTEKLSRRYLEKSISAGFGHFLLFLKKNAWEEGKSMERGEKILLRDPHLKYYLARNWKGDKEERERFINTIKENWNGIDIGTKLWILERRYKSEKRR